MQEESDFAKAGVPARADGGVSLKFIDGWSR
jgi:hypothetical protein